MMSTHSSPPDSTADPTQSLMPERIFALFGLRADQREQVQRMFLDAGMLDRLVEAEPPLGLYKIELASDEAAQRLCFAARANGIDAPIIQRYVDPTAKELAAAPLLYLRVGGTGTERAHPRADTTYDDTNACPQCGAGLRQTSPLRMRKTELPKLALATGAADELLLHESVADVVSRAGLRGIHFRPVLDKDGAEIPWQQMVVEETLPPMIASSRGMIRGRTGVERPCARCRRDGWFDTQSDPFVPAYARSVLDTMPDAAWTHELFGTGFWQTPLNGKRSLASRRLIVRPSMYRLLKPLKLRLTRWSPVHVE